MLVTVRDGRAIEIKGDPTHPNTAGVLCTKVSRYLERTYHPDRILHPMRRIGRKGEGRFERISWDEALSLIAGRLQKIATSDARAILPYSYAGTMGTLFGRWPGEFSRRLQRGRLPRRARARHFGGDEWAHPFGPVGGQTPREQCRGL